MQEQIYLLILNISRKEHKPKEWEIGRIVAIYKKGDQEDCKNYRGITLLRATYEISSTIIHRRLRNTTKSTIGQYQCDFKKGKSTTYAIHTLK